MWRLILCLLLLVSSVRADSPLTSTDFWTAYRDLPEVAYAHKQRRLDARLINYLRGQATIDRKAAVVNALGWDTAGQQNARQFRAALPKKDDQLTPHENFCLGYLLVMDDYFQPQAGLPYLQKARLTLRRSRTVALIEVLALAQSNGQNWSRHWPMTRRVLSDKTLEADLRPAAQKIIVDYMKLYVDS